MALLLFVVFGYHTQRYFSAFARTPATITVYTQESTRLSEHMSLDKIKDDELVLIVASASEFVKLEVLLNDRNFEISHKELSQFQITGPAGFDHVYIEHDETLRPRVVEQLPKRKSFISSSSQLQPVAYSYYKMPQ